MSVGGQTSSATVDQTLTDLAVEIRDWCYKASNLNTEINGGGNGLQELQNLGYQGAANANNPGGISDSQYALNLIADIMDIVGVYKGTVQFGGTGGTGAVTLDHNAALSPLWAGR